MVYDNNVNRIVNTSTDTIIELSRSYIPTVGTKVDVGTDAQYILDPNAATLIAASGRKSQSFFGVRGYNYINTHPLLDTDLYIGVGQGMSFSNYVTQSPVKTPTERSSNVYTNTQVMLDSTKTSDMQFGYALFNGKWLPADKYTGTGTDILGNKVPMRDDFDKPIIVERFNIIESPYAVSFGKDNYTKTGLNTRFNDSAAPKFYGVNWTVQGTPTVSDNKYTSINQTTGIGEGATVNNTGSNDFDIAVGSEVEFYGSKITLATPMQDSTATKFPSRFNLNSSKCILDDVIFNANGSSSTSVIVHKIPQRYLNSNGAEKDGIDFTTNVDVSDFRYRQTPPWARMIDSNDNDTSLAVQPFTSDALIKSFKFSMVWDTTVTNTNVLGTVYSVKIYDKDDVLLKTGTTPIVANGFDEITITLDNASTVGKITFGRAAGIIFIGGGNNTITMTAVVKGEQPDPSVDFNIAQRYWKIVDVQRDDIKPHIFFKTTCLPTAINGRRSIYIREIDARNIGFESDYTFTDTATSIVPTVLTSNTGILGSAARVANFNKESDEESVKLTISWSNAVTLPTIEAHLTNSSGVDIINTEPDTLTVTTTGILMEWTTVPSAAEQIHFHNSGAGNDITVGTDDFSAVITGTYDSEYVATNAFNNTDDIYLTDPAHNIIKSSDPLTQAGNLIVQRSVKLKFIASDTLLPLKINYNFTRIDSAKAAGGADDKSGTAVNELNINLRQYTIPHQSNTPDNVDENGDPEKAVYVLSASIYGYEVYSTTINLYEDGSGSDGVQLGQRDIILDPRVFDRNIDNLTDKVTRDGIVYTKTAGLTTKQFADFVAASETDLLGNSILTSRDNSLFTYNADLKHFYFNDIDFEMRSFFSANSADAGTVWETTGTIASNSVGQNEFFTRDATLTSFNLTDIPARTNVAYSYTGFSTAATAFRGDNNIGFTPPAWYRIPKNNDLSFEFKFMAKENVAIVVSEKSINLGTINLNNLSDFCESAGTSYEPYGKTVRNPDQFILFNNPNLTITGTMNADVFQIICNRLMVEQTFFKPTQAGNGLYIRDGTKIELLYLISESTAGAEVTGYTEVTLPSSATLADVIKAQAIFTGAVIVSANVNTVIVSGFSSTKKSIMKILGVTVSGTSNQTVTLTDRSTDYTILVQTSENPTYYFKQEDKEPIYGLLNKSGTQTLNPPDRSTYIEAYTARTYTFTNALQNSVRTFGIAEGNYDFEKARQLMNDLQLDSEYATLQANNTSSNLVNIGLIISVQDDTIAFIPSTDTARVILATTINPYGGIAKFDEVFPFRPTGNNKIANSYTQVVSEGGGGNIPEDLAQNVVDIKTQTDKIPDIKTQTDRLPTITVDDVTTGDVSRESTEVQVEVDISDLEANVEAVKSQTDLLPTVTVDSVKQSNISLLHNDLTAAQRDKIQSLPASTSDELDAIKTDIAVVNTDTNDLQSDTTLIKSGINVLTSKVDVVDDIVNTIETTTDSIKNNELTSTQRAKIDAIPPTLATDIGTLKTKVSNIESETDKISNVITLLDALKVQITNKATGLTAADKAELISAIVKTQKYDYQQTETEFIVTDSTDNDNEVARFNLTVNSTGDVVKRELQ